MDAPHTKAPEGAFMGHRTREVPNFGRPMTIFSLQPRQGGRKGYTEKVGSDPQKRESPGAEPEALANTTQPDREVGYAYANPSACARVFPDLHRNFFFGFPRRDGGGAMSVIRSPRKFGHTAIPNEAIQDRRLSWQARGLLCYLLATDPAKISAQTIAAETGSDPDEIEGYLEELQKAGYVAEEGRP